MAQPKKRLSKAAKAAKKILEESKLLAAKADNESNSEQPFKTESSTIKTAEAHKVRPDKKRG